MKKIMLIACLALVILGVAFVYTPDVEESDGYNVEPGKGLIILPNGASAEFIWETAGSCIILPNCPYEWEGHKFLYYAEDSQNWSKHTHMPGEVFYPITVEDLYCIWETIPPEPSDDPAPASSDNTMIYCCVTIVVVAIIAILACVFLRKH
jgi:hypothetical protein